MGIVTKVKVLDGSGNATFPANPPMFYVGGDGFTSAQNEGAELGTAQLTPATAKFVEGDITVSGGTPAADAVIFLLDL